VTESCKAILNETLLSTLYNVNSFSSLVARYLFRLVEQFFRALSKYFSGKDGSAPLEKIGPYAYAYGNGVMKLYLPASATLELQTLSRAERSKIMQVQLNSMWTDDDIFAQLHVFTVEKNSRRLSVLLFCIRQQWDAVSV